jgi:hypothetical protein
MAEQFKVNLIFQNGSQGWSETFYTLQNDLAGAEVATEVMRTARQKLLAPPAVNSYVRITGQATRGLREIYAPVVLPYVPYVSKSDVPATCARLTLYASSGPAQRPLYMRGIPDNLWDIDGAPSPDYITWLTQYQAAGGLQSVLNNGVWFVRFRDKTAAQKHVSLINPTNSPKQTNITTVEPHGFIAGNTVSFIGVRDFGQPFNTIKVVEVFNATSFSVACNARQSYSYPGGATVALYLVSYAPITSNNLTEIYKRDTGRPFGQHRGARPRRPR